MCLVDPSSTYCYSIMLVVVFCILISQPCSEQHLPELDELNIYRNKNTFWMQHQECHRVNRLNLPLHVYIYIKVGLYNSDIAPTKTLGCSMTRSSASLLQASLVACPEATASALVVLADNLRTTVWQQPNRQGTMASWEIPELNGHLKSLNST